MKGSGRGGVVGISLSLLMSTLSTIYPLCIRPEVRS